MTWNTLRSFRTARFKVSLQWEYDNDADLEFYDAATRAGIARGDYAPYIFRVVVLSNDHVIGADYLGDSVYSDPAEFAHQHFGIAPRGRAKGVTFCCYFPDMLRAAIHDARRTLEG
jgi:hypothetical protein